MNGTPQEALDRLLEGNRRFAEGRSAAGDHTARRAEVAAGQRPFAVVLTCSDSRVAPELVFDQGLGDLFVCRVAGNIVTPEVLGSVEYAVANFGCSLVVVLGHQRCGAVTDTLELVRAGESAPGSVQSIVEAIASHVDRDGSVDDGVRENARAAAARLSETSALADGHVHVVAAVYSLDTGAVELL